MSEQKQREIIHLRNGEVISKSNIGWRHTNSDGSEEYGTISYEGRTIAVKQIGHHLWEEHQENNREVRK